ncbi:hypothetical protein [Longimicrobium sp.]|uniref:hypothetical protein n=1 Tax=Longimicrobium sp. TaxID=2029185 RepID=UPI002C4D49DC|nr:hypothetical protein [Longimicrobium sp.]HSU17776.1 hypothetical protein [Longimicrobium sp.]
MSTPTISAIICPGCGTRNAPDAFTCSSCGRVLDDIRPGSAAGAASATAGPDVVSPERYSQQAPLLRSLGAVVIVLGVVGALWIVVKFGTMPATMYDTFTGGGGRQANPIAWAIALATVLNSVVVGSMCIGIAVAIENTAAIRHRLETQA